MTEVFKTCCCQTWCFPKAPQHGACFCGVQRHQLFSEHGEAQSRALARASSPLRVPGRGREMGGFSCSFEEEGPRVRVPRRQAGAGTGNRAVGCHVLVDKGEMLEGSHRAWRPQMGRWPVSSASPLSTLPRRTRATRCAGCPGMFRGWLVGQMHTSAMEELKRGWGVGARQPLLPRLPAPQLSPESPPSQSINRRTGTPAARSALNLSQTR